MINVITGEEVRSHKYMNRLVITNGFAELVKANTVSLCTVNAKELADMDVLASTALLVGDFANNGFMHCCEEYEIDAKSLSGVKAGKGSYLVLHDSEKVYLVVNTNGVKTSTVGGTVETQSFKVLRKLA
jgi:hypothetical protein